MKRLNPPLLFLLGILAMAAVVRAQDGPWRLGPEPRRWVLENGLTVVSQDDDAAANSVVQLFFRAGSRDDPPAASGLAFLSMRLALEIPDRSKLQQLMDFGSSFSLHVGEDYSMITIRTLTRHLAPTLKILTDILTEPLFSSVRIDAIKAQMRHLQKRAADEPNELMRTLTARNFFGSGGYGAALFGDEASLAAIGKKDIQAFFAAHFTAANMMAVIVSDMDESSLKPLLGRFLGRFPAGQKAMPPLLAPSPAAQPAMTVTRQSSQTHIACAVLLPGLSADNFLMATLLETWLGRGIGCRLWPLRDRSDLTYGVNADVLPLRDGMLLNVYLKTGSGRADEAQGSLLQILKTVQESGISEAEFATAKAYAQADHWRQNETRERRAATMAFMEGMGLAGALAGDFNRRLGAVEREDFNRFIRAALAPERWFVLRIGPQ